jgi:hypothetical protein
VENTGDVADTQDITFTVDGTVEDTETDVTLGSGETFAGQFTYDTVEGDRPEVDVTVSSADDAAGATVTVLEPATFELAITDIDQAVVVGETATVNYTVQNTGGVSATQNISFEINGTVEDTEAGVMLDSGATFDGQFTYDTVTGDDPAVAVAVASEDDQDDATVTVQEPATFAVNITTVDDTVTEGETITVDYEVENTGDVADTQDITFAVDGTVDDTQPGVELAGGETSNGTFSYETEIGDSPSVTVALSSADTTDSTEVTVAEGNPDLIASLSTEQGSVGDTIGVDFDVVSFDGQSDEVGSYQFEIEYNDSVLSYQGVTAGDWGSPSQEGASDGVVAVADFTTSGETPSEPALTFEFEIIAEGSSTLEFVEQINENRINDPNANAYQTQFENGTAGTTVSSSTGASMAGMARAVTVGPPAL